MKKTATLAVLATLIGFGASQSYGQTNVSGNIVRNLNVALTANVQTGDGEVTIRRIGSKDIVQAIATDQGVTVSSKSKLLLSVPADGSDGFAIIVRTGTNDIDATSFFSHSQIGDAVSQTRGNSHSDVSIQEFAFHSSSFDFDVQGYTTSKTIPVKNFGTSELINAAVAGTGDVGGNTAVYKGTINATAPKGEAPPQ